MRLRILMLLLMMFLTLTWANSIHAQDLPPAVEDPIEQLRLTPDQRQRIRLIFEENKVERQMTNRRLREANVAMDLALDAQQLDETAIEQRINELAAAQAAQLRMRIQTEIRIRRELRPEQLATLKRLRLQVRDFMGAQRSQRPANQGLRQNQRNSVAPSVPRRNVP